MNKQKNLPDTFRGKVGASSALGMAVSLAVLTGDVSFKTQGLAAIAFGVFLGILGWIAYYHSQPEAVKNSRYPFVGTQAMLKSVVLATAISAFVVSFAEQPLVKLLGAASFAATVGFLIGQVIFSGKEGQGQP